MGVRMTRIEICTDKFPALASFHAPQPATQRRYPGSLGNAWASRR